MANEEYLKTLLAEFKKPIPHSWRVQSYSKNKPIATVMAYIDARDCMEVLDTYSSYGWHREHYVVDGKVYCKVGVVMPDGSIQWRSDCGTESNQDAEKGQSSDSFKRACVNFGIGRFLYDLEIKYVDTNMKKEANNYPYCIDKQGNQIWNVTDYINGLNPSAPKAPSVEPKTVVKEPAAEQKAANLTKTPKAITKAEIDAELVKIKALVSAEGLAGYWRNLTADYQAQQSIVNALAAQRKTFDTPKK